jgi:hypothetical protein
MPTLGKFINRYKNCTMKRGNNAEWTDGIFPYWYDWPSGL